MTQQEQATTHRARRARPWVPAAAGVATGVLLADASPALALSCAAAAVVLALALWRASRAALVLPFLAFLSAGAARGFPEAIPLSWPARGEGSGPVAEVTGTVRRALLPSVGVGDRERWFELEDASLSGAGPPRPVVGRVRVRVPSGSETLARGTRISARGRLFGAARRENPGEADGRRRWRREGVAVGMEVPAANLLRTCVLPAAADPRARIDAGRAAVVERLRDALPPRPAGLAAALVLGVRTGLDAELKDAVAGTGTAHLLAISGLHLALLVGLLRALLGVVMRPTTADVTAAAAAVLYAAFAGAAAPVLRATVGAVVFHVGRAAGRRSGRFEPVAMAATILLLLDPAELFRPGFQLSFAAVTALVAAPSKRHEGVVRRLVVDPLLLSGRAALATAPIVLFHFGTVVPLGPLVTLAVTPLFLATFLASLAVAGGGAEAGAALLLEVSARAFTGTLELAASLPGMEWSVPRPPWLAALALLGAVLLVLLPVGVGARRLALPLLAVALGAEAVARRAPRDAEFVLLAVGHGQAAVLRTPAGATLLFDFGALGTRDVGRWLLLPALDALGVRTCNALFLSHADADHLNAAPALLAAGRVERVASGARLGETATARDVVEAARRARVPWRTLERGARLDVGPDLTVRVLAPTATPLKSENDDSLVLLVESGPWSLLLPGDVEERGIRRLLALEPTLRCDVLVLPHHGQPEPLLGPLLVRTRPRLVLASRASPLAEDVHRLVRRIGAEVHCTSDDGALRVRLRTDGNIHAETFFEPTDET